MKNIYKVKVNDIIEGCAHRVKIIESMINGSKESDPAEATQYLKEIKKGLEEVKEFVSIS